MKTHTPGPWNFVAEPGMPVVVYAEAEANDTDDVCTVACRKEDGITVANANLIAAAPELFAACKAFMECPPRDRHDIALEMLVEEAITKAEGRE